MTGDTNGYVDIFVRDTVSNTTTLVSVDSSGAQGNSNSYTTSISANGCYVVFHSYASNLVDRDTNTYQDIFVRDMVSQTTRRASLDPAAGQADNNSTYLSISADGTYVAFESSATNLVAGDTNSKDDILVYEIDITPPVWQGNPCKLVTQARDL